jgi:hypothetical protein
MVPDGPELILLPPAGRRWSLLAESVVNRVSAEVVALDAAQDQHCRVRAADRATLQSSAHFPYGLGQSRSEQPKAK